MIIEMNLSGDAFCVPTRNTPVMAWAILWLSDSSLDFEFHHWVSFN